MRLIDADEMAMNEICAYANVQAKLDDEITRGVNDVVHMKLQQLIADTPTEDDAVIVVRCKDCEMSEEKSAGRLRCKFWRNGVMKDWYCFEGKKRRNEDAAD